MIVVQTVVRAMKRHLSLQQVVEVVRIRRHTN